MLKGAHLSMGPTAGRGLRGWDPQRGGGRDLLPPGAAAGRLSEDKRPGSVQLLSFVLIQYKKGWAGGEGAHTGPLFTPK